MRHTYLETLLNCKIVPATPCSNAEPVKGRDLLPLTGSALEQHDKCPQLQWVNTTQQTFMHKPMPKLDAVNTGPVNCLYHQSCKHRETVHDHTESSTMLTP